MQVFVFLPETQADACRKEFVEGSQLLYATQRVGSLSMGSTGVMTLMPFLNLADSCKGYGAVDQWADYRQSLVFR